MLLRDRPDFISVVACASDVYLNASSRTWESEQVLLHRTSAKPDFRVWQATAMVFADVLSQSPTEARTQCRNRRKYRLKMAACYSSFILIRVRSSAPAFEMASLQSLCSGMLTSGVNVPIPVGYMRYTVPAARKSAAPELQILRVRMDGTQ